MPFVVKLNLDLLSVLAPEEIDSLDGMLQRLQQRAEQLAVPPKFPKWRVACAIGTLADATASISATACLFGVSSQMDQCTARNPKALDSVKNQGLGVSGGWDPIPKDCLSSMRAAS